MTRRRAATLAVLACLTLLPAGPARAGDAGGYTDEWFNQPCRDGVYGKWWPFSRGSESWGWVDIREKERELEIQHLGTIGFDIMKTETGMTFFKLHDLIRQEGHLPDGPYFLVLNPPYNGRRPWGSLKCAVTFEICETRAEVKILAQKPRPEGWREGMYCNTHTFTPWAPPGVE